MFKCHDATKGIRSTPFRRVSVSNVFRSFVFQQVIGNHFCPQTPQRIWSIPSSLVPNYHASGLCLPSSWPPANHKWLLNCQEQQRDWQQRWWPRDVQSMDTMLRVSYRNAVAKTWCAKVILPTSQGQRQVPASFVPCEWVSMHRHSCPWSPSNGGRARCFYTRADDIFDMDSLPPEQCTSNISARQLFVPTKVEETSCECPATVKMKGLTFWWVFVCALVWVWVWDRESSERKGEFDTLQCDWELRLSKCIGLL